MGNRAVSPVLGLVVLMGLVAIVGLSVLLVGVTVLDGAQSSAETAQAETSMEEFADTANEVAESEASTGEFALSGPEEGTAWVDETSGNVSIRLHDGNDTETLVAEDLGVYRFQTSDGTEIAYQGGGVWRYDDGEPVLVESPSFDYRTDPEPTLTFPIVRIAGEGADSGSVDGELRVAERRSLTDDLPNPITGDYILMDVESRYCEGWQRHVETRTEGIVEKTCGANDRLRVNVTVPEVEINKTVNETRTEGNVTVNGTYGLYAEDDIEISNAGGQINGSLGSGGNITFDDDAPVSVMGETVENIELEREPHDVEIDDMYPTGDVWESFCDPPDDRQCRYNATRSQPIYVDEFNGGADEVTFDVSDGNITLFIKDGFETEDRTQWSVVNHEDGGSVNVYVDGDMRFRGGDVVMGTGPDPRPEIPPAEANAEALNFFGRSNSEIEMSSNFHVEASISAPAGDSGASQVFDTQSGSIKFVGALHAGEISITSSTPEIVQDTDVASRDENVSVNVEEEIVDVERTLSDDSDVYYLHVSETVLQIED